MKILREYKKLYWTVYGQNRRNTSNSVQADLRSVMPRNRCVSCKIKFTFVPKLNQPALYEDVWWSGGIAPRILNLVTRWRSVVSLTPRPLYPQSKNPRYPLDRRLSPRACLDTVAKRNHPITAPAGNWNPGRPTLGLVTVLPSALQSAPKLHNY
jgi:hypothetical protein